MSSYSIPLYEIQRQIEKTPMATAACHNGIFYSYHDLAIYSNRLANYLKRHQVVKRDIVPFFMRRSFETLVTMLAIWKVGATYLSLDIDMPFTRLEYILQQIQPKCVVSEPAHLNSLPQMFPILTCQDPEYQKCSTIYIESNDENNKILPQEPAYLIYTSGSTGEPKGVLITHTNLANYLFWFNRHFKITNDDIFNFCSSSAFDFSITCTHAPLAAGAQIFITSETTLLDLEVYCCELINHRVTFVKWTPSYFKILINYVEKYRPDFSHLKYIMIAGEELLTQYLERWFAVYPSHSIINEYGPTETTVGITTQLVTKSSLNRQLKSIPIGQAIRNTTLYVVNPMNSLVAVGDVGELLIGGASVGLGYYKNPILTKVHFIQNPFSSQPDILYKTGDLVKQLPDKSYLYIGRTDNQVKINGYRVELNQIEHYLLQHDSVAQACILAHQEKEKNLFLEGYIVLKPEHSFNESEIRSYLSQQLPPYMIPQRFYAITHLPLTANGKLNRKVLLEQARSV